MPPDIRVVYLINDYTKNETKNILYIQKLSD